MFLMGIHFSPQLRKKRIMAILCGIVITLFSAAVIALASADAREELDVVPTLKCRHGFTLVGNLCIKQQSVRLTTKCSDNYLHEGKCVSHQHSDATMECPEGYDLSNTKECVRTTRVPLQLECPSGYYQPIPTSTECIKETHSKPHISCLEGFKMSHDGVCFKQTYEKASILCPKGYNPDRRGCFMSEKVNPVFTCPKQYTLQSNGKCVKEMETKCPNGYTLVTRKDKEVCEQIVVRDATPVCPQGTVTGETKVNCWLVEKEVPRFVCKHKNATYMNEKCIRVIEEDVSINCSEGFKFDGNHCVRKSVAQPEFQCSEAERSVKQSKCESIKEVPLISCEDSQCNREKFKQANIKCPDGAKMVDSKCEIIVSIDAKKICDNKGELRHGKCVYYEQKEPIIECKEGDFTKDGICVVREIIDMIVKCEKGFKLAEDGKECIKFEHLHPKVMCPSNAVAKGEKCVKVINKTPNKCLKEFTSEVEECIEVPKQTEMPCPKKLKQSSQASFNKRENDSKIMKSCPPDINELPEKYFIEREIRDSTET